MPKMSLLDFTKDREVMAYVLAEKLKAITAVFCGMVFSLPITSLHLAGMAIAIGLLRDNLL
jgi:hypothetical protein